jgi:hypothetical protein
MGADGAVGPAQALEILAGLGFVGKDRIVQVHGSTFQCRQSRDWAYLCQGYNRLFGSHNLPQADLNSCHLSNVAAQMEKIAAMPAGMVHIALSKTLGACHPETPGARRAVRRHCIVEPDSQSVGDTLQRREASRFFSVLDFREIEAGDFCPLCHLVQAKPAIIAPDADRVLAGADSPIVSNGKRIVPASVLPCLRRSDRRAVFRVFERYRLTTASRGAASARS